MSKKDSDFDRLLDLSEDNLADYLMKDSRKARKFAIYLSENEEKLQQVLNKLSPEQLCDILETQSETAICFSKGFINHAEAFTQFVNSLSTAQFQYLFEEANNISQNLYAACLASDNTMEIAINKLTTEAVANIALANQYVMEMLGSSLKALSILSSNEIVELFKGIRAGHLRISIVKNKDLPRFIVEKLSIEQIKEILSNGETSLALEKVLESDTELFHEFIAKFTTEQKLDLLNSRKNSRMHHPSVFLTQIFILLYTQYKEEKDNQAIRKLKENFNYAWFSDGSWLPYGTLIPDQHEYHPTDFKTKDGKSLDFSVFASNKGKANAFLAIVFNHTANLANFTLLGSLEELTSYMQKQDIDPQSPNGKIILDQSRDFFRTVEIIDSHSVK